ncbi:hypothetical protein ScPMuIL_009740 [Solemya velum]
MSVVRREAESEQRKTFPLDQLICAPPPLLQGHLLGLECQQQKSHQHFLLLVFQQTGSAKRLLTGALVVFVLATIGLTVGVICLAVKKNDEHEDSPTFVSPAKVGATYCMTKGCLVSGARVANGIDSTVDPCMDFYQFSCGQWKRTNVIPEDQARYSTMGSMRDDVSVILKYILESRPSPSDVKAIKKAKLLYGACMNESATEERGISVLLPLLQELGGWPLLGNASGLPVWNESESNLPDLLIKLKKYSNTPLFGMGVSVDRKQSSRRLITMDEPSLGLPSRDYFLKGRGDPIVEAYVTFAENVAMALGAEPEIAKRDISDFVSFEIDLANISDTVTARRNVSATYNLYDLDELQSQFPTQGYLSWQSIIRGIMGMDNVNISIQDNEPILVTSPNYFYNLFNVMEKHSNRTIVNYMMWGMIMSRTSQLPRRFREMGKDLRKAVSGTVTSRPWWKTCSSFVNGNLGLAVGRLFIKETFDEDAKTNANLIHHIRGAFRELISELDWMDDETRRVAVDKLNFMKNRVGYQEEILDDDFLNREYENVSVHPTNHFINYLNNLRRLSFESLSTLRQPVDKTRWTVTPSTVNAFYSRIRNDISFPAAFLQPPYYSKSQPNYLNFGGIGLVIGHEITHGFDNSGRQFDKNGNLVQWWSDEAVERFEKRASCIKDQYDDFVVQPVGAKVDGELTLGENIADNGGLKQTFRAYRRWVEMRGEEEPMLPGLNLTNNQLLFVNFAQGLCENMRPESALEMVRTDEHSPGRFRIIGSVQNSVDFAREFNCAKESPMNPADKCHVW